jgi:hypothetical protein
VRGPDVVLDGAEHDDRQRRDSDEQRHQAGRHAERFGDRHHAVAEQREQQTEE